MKRTVLLALWAVITVATFSACATYGTQETHNSCQANRSNNHRTARGAY